MMPLTCGLIRISCRGTTLPLATVFFTMSRCSGFSVTNATGFSADFW